MATVIDSKSGRVSRPQRWDEPYGAEMTPEIVAGLLLQKPFCDMDRSLFPKRLQLEDILLNDARVVDFSDGDIIVREGDYGNSAFLILDGTVSVMLDNLPNYMLGRKQNKKLGIFGLLDQLLSKHSVPEYREEIRAGQEVGIRKKNKQEASIFVQDVPRVLGKHKHVDLDAGELFGELAALGRTPRTATILSKGTSQLLEIRWQGLREIRNFAPAWKQSIDAMYRSRSLMTHLQETSLLQNLSEADVAKVRDATEFENYDSFAWQDNFKKIKEASGFRSYSKEPVIVSEGEYPNGLFLIRSGFVRVSHAYNDGEKTVSYLGKGQYFGMSEILHNMETGEVTGFRHSLRALGYVDVLFIPTNIVENVIAPSLSAAQKRKELAALRSSKSKGIVESNDTLEPKMLEFLVENRFINGKKTMLINMDRCTRCDDCVRACASTHEGNPRFIRQGVQLGNTMVANACMHCADPVCMIGCPTGAIHRDLDEGQVRINDLTCVGCATCANSCPYNNIHMVEARNKQGEIMMDEALQPVMKATKCDLCDDQITGPACERACPHDAMIRADMQDVTGLKEWLER